MMVNVDEDWCQWWLISTLNRYNDGVGGLAHLLFSIIYGIILPNWLSHFSRWLLHHQPDDFDVLWCVQSALKTKTYNGGLGTVPTSYSSYCPTNSMISFAKTIKIMTKHLIRLPAIKTLSRFRVLEFGIWPKPQVPVRDRMNAPLLLVWQFRGLKRRYPQFQRIILIMMTLLSSQTISNPDEVFKFDG